MITEKELKEIFNNQRKIAIDVFYNLLKNTNENQISAIDKYRKDYQITKSGDEIVWHHFLKENDWILGLNVDIKYISEFLDETDIGIKNTEGSGSPRNDMLGISNYTTLIELKTAKTEIFKRNPIKDNNQQKSNSRANTWAFTPNFIEGVSQCLGQKSALEHSYIHSDKVFKKQDGTRIDKEEIRTADPKTILIIGNRKEEFNHKTRKDDDIIKSETFERFRRNNRNVEIITFDELYERAYHIVFSKKINEDWYENK